MARGTCQVCGDGTPGGTTLVKDIFPGSSSAAVTELENVSGTLYFQATAGNTTGLELFKSDGTADGTQLVANINNGGNSSSPHQLTNVNGELYFAAEALIGPFVNRDFRSNGLQRHALAEGQIVGFVELAHPAAGNEAHDAEAAAAEQISRSK